MITKKISLIILFILLLFSVSCLSPNHRATTKYKEDKELEKVFSKEQIILIIKYSNKNEFESIKNIVEDDSEPTKTLNKYQLLSSYFQRNLHSDKCEKLLDLAITYAEIHENDKLASEFKVKKEELVKKRDFIFILDTWYSSSHETENEKKNKKHLLTGIKNKTKKTKKKKFNSDFYGTCNWLIDIVSLCLDHLLGVKPHCSG